MRQATIRESGYDERRRQIDHGNAKTKMVRGDNSGNDQKRKGRVWDSANGS